MRVNKLFVKRTSRFGDLILIDLIFGVPITKIIRNAHHGGQIDFFVLKSETTKCCFAPKKMQSIKRALAKHRVLLLNARVKDV